MENKEVYQKFCLDLKNIYLNELSGEGDNDDFLIGKRPSEKFLIGILDSGIANDEKHRYTSLPMVKVQFYLNKEDKGNLYLNLSGNLYYNVIPTYQEQLDSIKKINDLKKERNKIETSEEDMPFLTYEIVKKYKRICLSDFLNNIVIDKNVLISEGRYDFSEQLNKLLKENIKTNDAVFFKDKGRSINKNALENEEKYLEFIANNKGNNSDYKIFNATLNWKLKGFADAKYDKANDLYVVTVIIENITPKGDDYNEKEFEDTKYVIPIYNIGLKIKADGNIVFRGIKLPAFNDSYKVNSKNKAKGEWISAECINNEIVTNNVPTYIEMRLQTNEEFTQNANPKNLQIDPIGNLKTILEGMETYYDEISNIDIDPKADRSKYEVDLKKFKFEIKRFKLGISILEDDDFVAIKKAFICMNKAFENNFSSWRLFQLVFIVSMVSDIVYNDNKDLLESDLYGYKDYGISEMIYFPTGGGKTEAFLGTVALSMFYDRFTGKNYGVNTIIKYPLRLLSVQQLERTLKVIEKSNEVLSKTPEICNTPIFTLGYFVGSSNTPNKIKEDEVDRYQHVKEYILVNKCLNEDCKGDIDVIFNHEKHVLEHVCTKCGKILPLYIVDDEIYRYLPTIIVSTVDKMAQVSYNNGFRNILGASNYMCPKHGFCHSKKCSIDNNDELIDIYKEQTPSLAPTLFIQDEVHLLKESLGVFSSHYESLLNYYVKELLDDKHRKNIKYIGATATISGADFLVKELYNKDCRIFPSGSVYENGDNFYAYRDKSEISRIIIGFAPFGDSINARIEYIVSTYRLILCNMYNNSTLYAKKYNISEKEFKDMLFYYWTSIVYCGSKNDNNKLRNTFEQQGNDGRLIGNDLARFNITRMTGDESFSQIKDSLNQMTAEPNKTKTNNLVLATSTISHGVDSKEFNSIYFYGIPSNAAEYIQSYSRVGRTVTGMVVDIIRLARNRDVSFLKYFNMMHKYKDYLIDETRLNSKSIVAMYHTFPGIFISLFKHYYSLKDHKKYETLGSIDDFFSSNPENIKDFYKKLCIIYKCENVHDINSIDAAFKNSIRELLEKTVLNLHRGLRTGTGLTRNKLIKAHIGELTSNNLKTMSSLRDVDITYNIGINFGGDSIEEE